MRETIRDRSLEKHDNLHRHMNMLIYILAADSANLSFRVIGYLCSYP